MSSTLEAVHAGTENPQVNQDELTYEQQHKPSSEFSSREQYLEHELQIMAPKRWRPNLPFKDYRFELEDTIPAMAATIGKVVMVGAIAATFAGALGLNEGFVLENVRYELLIALCSLFFSLAFYYRPQTLQVHTSINPFNSNRCGRWWAPNGFWVADWCFWFTTRHQ